MLMMDRGHSPSATVCTLCGEAFQLPEDDIPGNLPRILLCGHIFCTFCLLSVQCDDVIRCPNCEVESALPEGGVYGLQEDSRIVGLIYTAKINKMKRSRYQKRKRLFITGDINTNIKNTEQPADIKKIEKAVDEALVQAAENLAKLEHINETLMAGVVEEVKREQTHLKMEIKQATDEALHAVQKWADVQLHGLTKPEAQISSRQAVVTHVQERIKALVIAMQIAREVRRVPFLEQYCILDKVLETLQAPVDETSFDMKCVTKGPEMSCVFQSESLSQSLVLSLKMEVRSPKHNQPNNSNTKSLKKKEKKRNDSLIPDRNSALSTPDKQKQENPEGNEPSSQGSTPSPRPHKKRNSSGHSPSSDLKSPDVIIEELFEETRPESAPPTGPELASNKWKVHRRRENHLTGNKRKVTQWVVVTHVVNPSHFYVRYVAEIRESEILSKKISDLCCKDGCLFKLEDTVESGSLIFAKCKEGVWSRSRVVKVFQNGSVEAVKGCIVTQLASVQVFFPDYGFTKSIFIQSTFSSKERTTESSLKAVNSHLRKVGEFVKVDLDQFAPQAIRCSLKDLVPFDLTKGWSREAQVQLCSIVGSSAVEMWPLGQDRDSLLVDLRKTPMEQSTDVPISVREYLVFIEVARFYSPVTLDRKPLMYYPPVYPQINKELNAVVCHINNPADFYIQLVDNMESLLLSAKLQDCYNATHMYGEEELRVYCPVIGQACAARFEDKLWYRAQVIGHPGQRKVEVQYVDYGNKKILSVSDLRKIKDEFLALPAKAIPCSLADVIPVDGKTWSEACTNRFISLAHQQCVTIVATETVSKNKSLPIKVFESGLNGPEANIAELLVKEELACFKEGLELKNKHSVDDSAIWDPPLELTSLAEEVDTPEQIISGEEDPLQPQMKLPVQLKDLRVRVSFINSPSSFYIQFTQNNSQLKRICELVKQECTQAEAQDVVWKADMYCAAHINGVWERGQICSDVTSDNIAEVRRCDHGNKVMVHVSSLRLLPSSLMGSFALECTISDIRPAGGRSTWTDTACDVFCYYLTGASALMTIKELTDERPVPVTLFCSNKMGRFISIADFLVNEGLALRERKTRPTVVQEPKETDAQTPASESPTSEEKKTFTHPDISSGSPSSSIISVPFRPKPTARTIMSPEKVATSLYLPPELPCLGHVQMTVSAVGDDGLIYVRTQNADYQLQQLRKKIQQSIKTLPRQKPYTWRSVQGCAVFGPDMLWYRGQLLELLGGHVKVQYVDYGLVENIPVVHVYPILLCGDVPQLCMSCQLLSINPVGGKWQRDAVALMREALLSRSVDLQVVELPANPREPLTVELFLDGLSFSKVLCHLEHASMNWTLSTQKGVTVLPAASLLDDWDFNTEGLMEQEELMLEPFINPNLPKEGKDFQVMVKHLWTPNELFLWPLEETDVEIDKETLDEALTRINANIKTLPRLTSFPCDGPCMAEYSDGKYYRAKLLKITSVEPVMILVQHVDFGSDDTLPTSKLRQIPAELLQFPLQGLKVKVAGFKAPSVNREEDVLPYSPGWSVKAALDMIELLHGNIKATVVAREPELSVLLYNKDKELVHLPLVNNGLAELE
ncbi:RING finger protein 17 isoform X2 [Melanotaenia boesemani]|uniref:RING finger protein 17 isoform X2 n=1 Tax=Melanotaenia boesemani TaxID=1250792 RepID=UPI001C043B6E|nr:RING finger protein 17 isoform X2 [Melanotaenia boesemani]